MTKFADLDQFDHAILDLIQADNQRTHAQIGDEVGLSSSAVRRRLKVMRDAGIIARDVAILKPSGSGVRFIMTLSFLDESLEAYEAFDAMVQTLPEVQQSYYVSGSVDYVLIIHGPSVEWYDTWSKRVFMSNPNIQRYNTHIVWANRKFETAIPSSQLA